MIKSLFYLIIIWGLLVNCLTISYAGQIYKFKDSNGNWVFSDQPPQKDQSFETLKYSQDKKATTKVELYHVESDESYTLYAKNLFYAPIEIGFTSPFTQEPIRKVIPARGSEALLKSVTKTPKINYQLAIGDPNSVAEDYSYHPPFFSPKDHRITQAFNGKFSHTNEYNRYAVDIAMDIGTYITAVRDGTVIWVKDNYHMSGTTQYFLDKANGIKVLHDDGTFSSYAHILMDTALVKEGDQVVVGQRLARSGSSGFSTGPHLHFSIIKNSGLKNIAIPFKFIDNNGKIFTPKSAMTMVGSTQP